MSTPARDAASDPAAALDTVTIRVLERVRQAGTADTPAQRPRRRQSDRTLRSAKASPGEAHEARSLRRVFLDMGDSYRAYRERTGAPVSAAVKSAAERFRRERNLTSLTAVAASLDQVQGLTW
jgi:hypothetical protein